MKIQSMFQKDIDRKINGVVKVNQDESDVLVQELNEYIITKELKKHIIAFFKVYNYSFDHRTDDIGVWISGFFGSGKSHFLKMLSYLLENREVQGIRTVERFREKFQDDPGTFMMIDRATRGRTDTILFNIDVESLGDKDKTAVLRVFAKMFYNYCGFYGEDLKVARLEQEIEKIGKTEEFRRAFEEIEGDSWLNRRDSFAFLEDSVVESLKHIGWSESAAENWFNSNEKVDMSIAKLVSEIKEYVDKMPEDFRLLFMIDEVGQYVGADSNMLLNLQSLSEELGTKCGGKVWIVCTGQEAIDEIIKVREDHFSKIQARFKTRLSISSSSAEEVIQKRILAKKDAAKKELEKVYEANEPVLRNLFSFKDCVQDIRGFKTAEEFANDFPFVPYQFLLIQKVFTEIRKHGNSGKHLASGARSMLSGFQEAAQKIEDKNELALAPIYLFYDTVHTFLDNTIRAVIERCERAAENGEGLEPLDVDVLKLLYLIRYIDDVKANLENIVILMADNINMDKLAVKDKVRDSLDRLLKENYISRTGEIYKFLTDEEQDIAREIKNITVETSAVVERIGHLIFEDIYVAKKYHQDKYDFPFDRLVDNMPIGNLTGGISLNVLTTATDPTEKTVIRLLSDTADSKQAIVKLADTSYFEKLENAIKIEKYIKQRNVSQLPKSKQDIISGYRDESEIYESEGKELLNQAIEKATFYAGGECLQVPNGGAKSKLDQVLGCLVSNVYNKLEIIDTFVEADADIRAILNGHGQTVFEGGANRNAIAEIERYLEAQYRQNRATTMAEVQNRYKAIPYGWRELDIAAVVAELIFEQKVLIKYAGETIQPDDPKIIDMLRKKTEIGKTIVVKRQLVSVVKLRKLKEILNDFFGEMNLPENEDSLVDYAKTKFQEELEHYRQMLSRYDGRKYPGKNEVVKGIELLKDILSRKKDNMALIEYIIEKDAELGDLKDDIQEVKDFFNIRRLLFDAGVEFINEYQDDEKYFSAEDKQTFAEIREILTVSTDRAYNYSRIPKLNELMSKLKEAHASLLSAKQMEILDIVRVCLKDVHEAAGDNEKANDIARKADTYFNNEEAAIRDEGKIIRLDARKNALWDYKDRTIAAIEVAKKPQPLTPPTPPNGGKTPKKNIKKIYRQSIFQARTLSSEQEIDEYVEKIRRNMKAQLKNCDGIEIL